MSKISLKLPRPHCVNTYSSLFLFLLHLLLWLIHKDIGANLTGMSALDTCDRNTLDSTMMCHSHFSPKNLQETPGLGSNTFYQIQIQIQINFFRSFKYKYKYKYTGKNLIKYKYKYSPSNTNTNTNTHWDRYIIAAILQMTYSNSFYCKEIVLFIQISLKIVSKGPICSEPALVQIMAWHWVGNKPLSDQWWPGLLMHKCITQSKWVNIKCWLLFECGITPVMSSVKSGETKTCTRWVNYFIKCPGNIFDQRPKYLWYVLPE